MNLTSVPNRGRLSRSNATGVVELDTFKSSAPTFALARLPLVRDAIHVAASATWLVIALVAVVLAVVLAGDLPVDLLLLPEAQVLLGPVLVSLPAVLE